MGLVVLCFGIAIIIIWPSSITDACCRKGICPNRFPTRFHQTIYTSHHTPQNSTYYFNQYDAQQGGHSARLQELILYFFKQNNLLNNELMGHPIYTLQEATTLLEDRADQSEDPIEKWTSKLYQFVVANMMKEVMANESMSIVEPDFETSGDTETSGSGSGDGESGLERSQRRHRISTDGYDRNRPYYFVEQDDFLPEIQIGSTTIGAGRQTPNEAIEQVDRFFSEQLTHPSHSC